MKNHGASTLPRSAGILGAGAWGTTLALLAAEAGHTVTLVAHTVTNADFMTRHRRHPTSLPGVTIPASIRIVHTDELHIRPVC